MRAEFLSIAPRSQCDYRDHVYEPPRARDHVHEWFPSYRGIPAGRMVSNTLRSRARSTRTLFPLFRRTTWIFRTRWNLRSSSPYLRGRKPLSPYRLRHPALYSSSRSTRCSLDITCELRTDSQSWRVIDASTPSFRISRSSRECCTREWGSDMPPVTPRGYTASTMKKFARSKPYSTFPSLRRRQTHRAV